MSTTYRAFEVPVEGGLLRVGRWGTKGPVVVAAHGITANHRSFRALAEELGDGVTLLAPDLRGRAGSRALPGPFSMARHADDLAAVLDHLDVERALVVGHSMGGFVAAVLADRHPGRVARLVLLDGGVPLDLAPLAGLAVEELTQAVIGPSLDRLRMTFASREAYLDFWRVHPAFAGDWNAYVEDYLDHDLVGDPPALRPSASLDAVLGDAESELVLDDVPRALDHLRHPALLVRAARGLLDGDALYAPDWVAQWQAKLPSPLRVVTAEGVNHFTLVLSARGAAFVADAVRGELAAVR